MGKYFFIVVSSCFAIGCIESFEFETETFEDALVIQASLTNENKKHRVILSRAVRFEDSISAPERNAIVSIRDENQNVFSFQETTPGTYFSSDSFAAEKGVEYTLEVSTSDGTSYSSNPERFESESEITEIYAERGTNDVGEEGIHIFMDGQDLSLIHI